MFVSTFWFDSRPDLLDAVADIDVTPEVLVKCRDLRVRGYAGWVYWFLYLKGYLEYREAGMIGAENTYQSYIANFPELDMSLAGGAAEHPASAADRTASRFRTMDLFFDQRREAINALPPILLFVGSDSENRIEVCEKGRKEPLKVSGIDGWHRLFGAWLVGVGKLRSEVVYGFGSTRP
jgi:hypothetical protein